MAAYCQLSFKAQLGLLRRDQFLRSCPLRDRVLRTRFRRTHKKYALRARRRASRTPRGNRKVSGIPPGQGANELLRAIPAPSKVVPASRQQKKLYGQLFARHKHFSWPCVYCVDAGPRPFKSSSSSVITMLWKVRGIEAAIRASSAPLDCCFSLSELCAYPLRETPIAEASNCALTNRLFFIFSVRARSVSSRLTFRILG